MTFINEKIVILYGSQTGNAQDLAEQLWRETKRFFFQSAVRPLDDYNVLELVKEKCVIFVCSTTGQGEEPDNMKHFWRFLLKKSLPSDSLSNLRFAVLGLGDSSYTKFNFVAKRLHKRLAQLGGQSIVPLGLGDDQHDLGYNAVADGWFQNLVSKLLKLYPVPADVKVSSTKLPIEPRWIVKKAPKLLSSEVPIQSKTQSLFYSTKECREFIATILSNDRVTDPTHFQDIRSIKLQTNCQRYSPGDVIVLKPKNLPWKVQEFKEVLKCNGIYIPDETVFNVTAKCEDLPVPEALKLEVTFHQLCEEYFDLFSIPRRSIFQILSQLTDSELEKEKCLEFCSAEGQQEMYSYVNRPKRNIVEVLADFPNATKNLTPDILFEIMPPIKPREFSIASSFRITQDEIHILVAVVKYKTKLVKERVGLCSSYLADLKKGDRISVWIKRGTFKFPKDLVSPVIMVGPGTGVAPFKSFIFEMISEVSSQNQLILFYGCRYQSKDFICKEEFEDLCKQDKLTLICAFSRDQEQKVYVQDRIKKHGDVVWKALKNDGYIFVAGNSRNMPKEVREAFSSVCQIHGKMSDKETERFLSNMEKKGRYQTECWS